MKQRMKHDQCWEMAYSDKRDMAKKIAKLLSESAATVDDMYDIFQWTREYLVVRALPETEEEWDELQSSGKA